MMSPLRILLLFALTSACWADSIQFTGSALYGNDMEMFSLNGSNISLFSDVPHATADLLFSCGATCTVPAFAIAAIPSFEQFPWETSSGTFNGIQANSLLGDLDFSESSNGLISFTGTILGYHEICQNGDCHRGALLFNLFLSGTGTVTPLRPVDLGNGQTGYYQVGYSYSGSATLNPVPEPGTWMLLGIGLLALGGYQFTQFWRQFSW